MVTVSIHQPNFFPYYPFFQKMEESDVFVVMAYCQYEKGGYQNRFNIGDNWYTMSVRHGLELINKKEYLNVNQDFHTIKSNLPVYADILKRFDGCLWQNLYITNYCIIRKIAEMLKLKTEIVHDYKTVLTGTARLVHICQNHGANRYLSGISGKRYLDMELFEKAGIEVVFQDEAKMICKPILEVLHERGK